MSTIWLVMVAAGVLTFLTRFSFIAISGRWYPPAGFRRALQFVPVAVLTAIIVPELFAVSGKLAFSPINPRFIAAAVALAVACKTRNTILTIVVGMLVFWLGSFLAA
jgi:branched-subunit amino acid transport protein